MRKSLVYNRDSAEAIVVATAQEMPFDLLISDIEMPGEDGYTLLHKVRSLPSELGGRIPAVALTAYTRSKDRRACLLAGFLIARS